jgi:hypothetical protein
MSYKMARLLVIADDCDCCGMLKYQIVRKCKYIVTSPARVRQSGYFFLTSWSKALLAKLTGFQLVKKFTAL